MKTYTIADLMSAMERGESVRDLIIAALENGSPVVVVNEPKRRIGALESRPVPASYVPVFGKADSKADKPRRINGARVAYRPLLVTRGSRKGEMVGAPENTPDAYAVIWKAIARSRKPVTALQLEEMTGRVKKTVESAVWFLRTNGAVESVALDSL